jgi:polar amino acid transport system permease protein
VDVLFHGLLGALANTVGITLGALLVGLVLAVPVTWAARSTSPAVSGAAVAFIQIVRSVPVLVWLFLIYFGLGGGMLPLPPFGAAVAGLGIVSSAYVAEIYRSGLAAIPAGQRDAIHSLALPAGPALRRILLPQLLPIVLPPLSSYTIGLLKDSALASIIGVKDLTAIGYDNAQTNMNGLLTFTIIGLIYIGLSVPVAALSRHVGNKVAARA